MNLACDTDYLTKVEHWDLAPDALAVFGKTREESYRLPAAVHQLRRGRLMKRFAGDASRMIANIEKYKVFSDDAPAEWLNKMTGVEAIDPGEAEFLARVADGETLILATGDKRCLQQICNVDGLTAAIARRVVTLDGMLLHLCETKGVGYVRELVTPKAHADGTALLVFSPYASDESVTEGLRSFHSSLLRDTGLTLWSPE